MKKKCEIVIDQKSRDKIRKILFDGEEGVVSVKSTDLELLFYRLPMEEDDYEDNPMLMELKIIDKKGESFQLFVEPIDEMNEIWDIVTCVFNGEELLIKIMSESLKNRELLPCSLGYDIIDLIEYNNSHDPYEKMEILDNILHYFREVRYSNRVSTIIEYLEYYGSVEKDYSIYELNMYDNMSQIDMICDIILFSLKNDYNEKKINACQQILSNIYKSLNK